MKNLKPLIVWVKQKGEAKIIDRILLKILPQLLEQNQKLTSEMLDQSSEVNVPESLYNLFVETAEQLVGESYAG